MGIYFYVAYSQDKYRLPIAVADSVKELGEMIGIDPNNISRTISRSNYSEECIYRRFKKEDD